MISTVTIFWYAMIPTVVSLIGGGIAAYCSPSKKWSAIIQHFVAGIVISAVASDLMPKLFDSHSPASVAIGFIIGVVAMLLVHSFAHFIAKRGQKGALPYGLVFASAIDLLIDGLLIGVAFAAGKSSGMLIAISLSFCAFFLNLSVGTTLSENGSTPLTRLITTLFIAIMLPIGAIIGGTVVAAMPYSLLLETIAFGVAALLFLGCEELLGPAHRKHHSNVASIALFLGFLIVLMLKF